MYSVEGEVLGGGRKHIKREVKRYGDVVVLVGEEIKRELFVSCF